MANKAAVECVDALLQYLNHCDTPFGGQQVVALGNFRQVAPVVKGGGLTAAFDSSIKSSYLWPHFQIFQLTIPIRNASDPEYANWVDAIGEGLIPTIVSSELQQTSSDEIKITDLLTILDTEELAHQFLYPNHILCNPIACLSRAFLTLLNRDVDDFNKKVLERLPTQAS